MSYIILNISTFVVRLGVELVLCDSNDYKHCFNMHNDVSKTNVLPKTKDPYIYFAFFFFTNTSHWLFFGSIYMTYLQT